jgi:hypothetical protein
MLAIESLVRKEMQRHVLDALYRERLPFRARSRFAGP